MREDGVQLVDVADRGAVQGAVGQQQLQIVVPRIDRTAERGDRVAGQQLTPQALDGRPQQRVSEGEALLVALGFQGPADDGENAKHLFGVVPQPAEVGRYGAVQHALLADALGTAPGRLQRAFDQIVQIRSEGGIARPVHSRRGIEEGDALGSGQQRAHQLEVGVVGVAWVRDREAVVSGLRHPGRSDGFAESRVCLGL